MGSASLDALCDLLRAERHGLLATLSATRGGWPFGSLVAYALTPGGEPLLLLSDLAEHTRNLRADGRASLLVHDSARLADPQAAGRVTLLGTVEPVSDAETQGARERYVERHPSAADYLALADFHFYVLRAREARFVGGFGDMGWLAGDQVRAALLNPI